MFTMKGKERKREGERVIKGKKQVQSGEKKLHRK